MSSGGLPRSKNFPYTTTNGAHNMKAIEISGTRDVRLIDKAEPVISDPEEVIVKVKAVSICGTDSHLIAGDYPGFWPPAFPAARMHFWSAAVRR